MIVARWWLWQRHWVAVPDIKSTLSNQISSSVPNVARDLVNDITQSSVKRFPSHQFISQNARSPPILALVNEHVVNMFRDMSSSDGKLSQQTMNWERKKWWGPTTCSRSFFVPHAWPFTTSITLRLYCASLSNTMPAIRSIWNLVVSDSFVSGQLISDFSPLEITGCTHYKKIKIWCIFHLFLDWRAIFHLSHRNT